MAKKKKYRPSRGRYILVAVIAVAMLAGAFGLGWHFGVRSTEYHGNILLVNERHRLDADYVPDELVNLYQQRHSFRMASSEIYLTRPTYEAMEQMFHAAEEADMNVYIVTSGYRSYQRQQAGLAFDVTVATHEGFESTPQYSWLMQHAHEYGFIQRYPANKSDITGISYEPWHYRYVGVDAATRMWKTGQTLEEYMGDK